MNEEQLERLLTALEGIAVSLDAIQADIDRVVRAPNDTENWAVATRPVEC
jgi:hypothetical protein